MGWYVTMHIVKKEGIVYYDEIIRLKLIRKLINDGSLKESDIVE